MDSHHPQRLAFATATTAYAPTGGLLTDVNRAGKADLSAATNGEDDFRSLFTNTTTSGPSHIGISTGDNPRLGMITAG